MRIKLLAMDVDGTLTDGRIFIGAYGEVMKAFDVKDGYGIVQFRNAGGIPVVITGRHSEIVEERCRELGIKDLFQGVENKLECLKKVANRFRIGKDQIAYIGDDLNDLECIKYAGFSACPGDAVPTVRKIVDYVCVCKGGKGAVREVIDLFHQMD